MKKIINLIVLLGLGLNVSCLFSDEEIQTFIDCADRRAGNTDGVLTNEHFLFVTAIAYNGNLGGLTGADAKCQTEADTADLERCYKAVMGDDSNTAASRLIDNGGALKNEGGIPPVNAGEIGPLARTVIEADLTKFTTPTVTLDVVPNREIGGSASGVANVWTGLQGDGTSDALNCANWTNGESGEQGGFGDNTATALMGNGPEISTLSGFWLDMGSVNCDQERVLYCVSQ